MFKRRKPEEPPTTPQRGHVVASGIEAGSPSTASPGAAAPSTGTGRPDQRGMFDKPSTGGADPTIAIPAMPVVAPASTPSSPVTPAPQQIKEPTIMSRPPMQPTPPTGPTMPQGGLARAPMAPARMPQQSSERRTLVVGRGISVQGTITDAERLVVEGTVEASSLNAQELQIAQGGVLKGQVEVEDAEISGLMDGMLTVRGSLVLRGTGQVIGEARCRRLQVEDGGQLSGKISMITGDAPPSSVTTPHVSVDHDAS